MLTRLHVQGYKALRDIDTTLEPLTVLVGPNGCGKTSVLESIALVRDFFSLSPGEALKRHPLEELKSKDEARLGVQVDLWARVDEVEGITSDLKIFLSHDEQQHGVGFGSRLSDEIIRKPSEATDAQREATRKVLLPIRQLALDVEGLARPSYLRDVAPRIEDDGSGLATVLSTLIGEQREKFDEYHRWREDMTPSEFWTVFGEEWLATATEPPLAHLRERGRQSGLAAFLEEIDERVVSVISGRHSA